ncbi:hypothetical protein U27_01418 [Candidatus Vecturithrix granuli]|uniref:Uncharacterized protein n=1 Tax=Vecturithrix granuli TaxID=1499967 RepID=A0A081CAB2_VECG1|nr:hypothetical protein U27_01418 [Candidatus Vecturithrix granuli]
MKTLIKPWKGLKHQGNIPVYAFDKSGENPNKTLEGIKTVTRFTRALDSTAAVKTLIKPWKGLKPLAKLTGAKSLTGENPNKTLEGIKTLLLFKRFQPFFRPVKTLIKPWKGLKQLHRFFYRFQVERRENPNKTLEGIKTGSGQPGQGLQSE